jgi:hypothetical protein
MNATTMNGIPHRRLIGALIACLLTVVLLGEIGPARVLATQHALLLQA